MGLLERILHIIVTIKHTIVLVFMMFVSVAAAQEINCYNDQSCGNMTIPYPFVVSESCALEKKFFINCSTKEPMLGENVWVTNISIQTHEISITSYVARLCYKKSGTGETNRPSLRVPKFTISSSKNKFTVIGCDSYGYLYGNGKNQNYSTGCFTRCESLDTVSANNSCSGIGCCQIDIPSGFKNISLGAHSFFNHSGVMDFNPCTYAFVVEKDKFSFSRTYLAEFPEEKQPLVLEWAIDKAANQYMCGKNATKEDKVGDGSGYYCKCNQGYVGNPYLPHGCQGIIHFDECQNNHHNCTVNQYCINTEGNYTCQPKNQPDQLLVIKITIAMELEGLRKTEKHPWVNEEVMNMEEIEYLLAETSNANDGSITTSAYDSVRNPVSLDFSGR
ncbi:hypothetical protein FEM48_Zijuj01G0334300 [Ziziphus jujuba var. spinosa]|uniref:Wall-associated receptor kinase galacturonan-binding domain-containing protein n=1 Tax=Ziziphus jujuba var. spinosa TaxID=714518 RepID=A0A978W6T1_ZIZJJ|nr:hypothetical protein FEM48_Zijuj01G0334300 [Ziziphus jujuba var. spinosa]